MMTVKMWLNVFLLTAGLLASAESQTCPSYTAGFTGTNEMHDSSSGRLYVNEAPSSFWAPCDGTVYRWHYCYYPTNRQNDLEVAFGAFRATTDDGDVDRYYLRTGSYYLLHLDARENSFTCGSVDLDEQDYFQIYGNDRVGACMRNGNNEFLDILAESAPNNYRVGRWGSSSGSCEESDMSQSTEGPGTDRQFILHLYVDINIEECALGEDNCHATLATCTDVVGGEDSFNCTCIAGYTGDGVTCNNIDECQLELDACVENADCSDTEGSYECICSSGYSGDGLVNCENVNECTEDTHMCDDVAMCSDTVGSYTCTCITGYTGFTCNDINECEDGTHGCDENTECTNTDGSYTCSCSSGYSGNGTFCDDINECETSSVNCDSNASCMNSAGSYECTCEGGYSGDRQTCTDIDECAAGIDGCDENANCTNTDGSYTCSCLSGYSGDGVTCVDIDECETSATVCDSNALCTNIPGSYECNCNEGYAGNGASCTDINECEVGTYSCDENADCVNNAGSYSCVCESGYTGDGFSCFDIDECDESSNSECDSNGSCTNIPGSYECSCGDGYSGDGFSCTDINECETGIASCGENAHCASTEGSYTCSCSAGFTGDGTICTDINECLLDETCDSDATCNNNVGSYTCQCNSGYTGNGSSCSEIEPTLEEAEGSEGSQSSGNVLAIILGVVGSLLVLSFVVIVAIYVIRRKKLLLTYKPHRSGMGGIDNAIYSNNDGGVVQLGAINTTPYDYSYPTLTTLDTKPPVWSSSPLEFYSSAEYSEVVGISPDNSSASFRKTSGSVGQYETQYYLPASQEEDLYSQLRQEKIKAIPKEEIEIDERLGSGEFGDVVKGYWKSVDYSVEVALKTLSGGQGQEGRRKLLQEAAIMSQFRHPNVVKLYGVVNDDNDKLMLVLELLGKGDLRQLLHTMRPDPGQLVSPQTPMRLLNYSQQIAVGLQYLSRKNFVHRDLAARNILISNDNTCKISDFGMARNLLEDDYYVSQGGKIPIKWTAPEALVYRKYSTASDMWSYGCVLYEIWSLAHKPFESMANQEVLVQVEAGYRLPPPPGCPQVIYDLMIRSWHPDPSSRPTAADVVLALMENEETVLRVPEEDAATSRLAGVLGAPLEAGQDMYPDLQETYYSSLQAQMSSL